MKRTFIAIGIQVAIMVLVLVPPLMVIMTGTTVYLETDKMDPRSLFRGHFAILGYLPAQDILPKEMGDESRKTGKPIYVTFTTDRPAKFVGVSLEKPKSISGQVCIVGRARGSGGWNGNEENKESVDFPQIAQYFAPKKEAKEIEGMRGDNLLAVVKVTGGCNAVLKGLESR
ncbi:GDYXXLXY domain-containing protein [Patescibacteria group bacterium]|nr:GDYXXLXY domain-containing protein [Patescibacteria group bacterium]